MERVDRTQPQFAVSRPLIEELRAIYDGEVLMPGDAGFVTITAPSSGGVG
jgi:hypothetical protein